MARWATVEHIDRAVREGKYAYLAELIRHADELSPEVRDHLATVALGALTGKIKRPKHRPQKAETEWRAKEIAERVVSLGRYHGWDKRTAAVQQVCQEYGCGPSTVYAALRKFRVLIELKFEEHEYDAMLDAAYESRREMAIESLREEFGDREFSDEEVADAEHEVDQASADAWDLYEP